MPDPILAVDVRGLTQLAKDLNKIADKDLRNRLRKGLRAGGNIVAAAAKANASWSGRIPGSIRVGVTTKGVYVRAGGPKAPHAVVFEGKVDGGDRRHPVFATGDRGTWHWAVQPKKPFLVPALNANAEKVAALAADEIEKAFKDNGFH